MIPILTGPTSSGKSALAGWLAETLFEQYGVRILLINADAVQLYKDIPILAGTPSEDALQRVPHFFYNVLTATEPTSVAWWCEKVAAQILLCQQQGCMPLLVGGTGLYLKALMEGLAPIPDIPLDIREATRLLQRTQGQVATYALLQQKDPLMATRILPTDAQRTCRALEVWEATGESLASWQSKPRQIFLPGASFDTIVLAPERSWLYAEATARFEWSFDHGATEEVAQLLATYPEKDWKLRALGLYEIRDYLQNACTKQAAIAEATLQIRHYVKRQLTWMTHQFPHAHFLHGKLADIDRQTLLERVKIYCIDT